jgi:predicted Fe-S protein YdhL (DUF1289 family)
LGKNKRIPSPCIDVCEDIRGVCIGCGRTKKDEKAWKKATTDAERLELLRECLAKTEELGVQKLWLREYQRKCIKKGADPAVLEFFADAFADAAAGRS